MSALGKIAVHSTEINFESVASIGCLLKSHDSVSLQLGVGAWERGADGPGQHEATWAVVSELGVRSRGAA